MDLIELGDMGIGCEDENCSLAAGLLREDCSDQDCQREEHIFGLIELVCVTIIYIPLMLLGLVGNILTILVVWLRPHMRSSTYLYLSSMAVSDLLILLLLPLDLYKIWRPRPWPLGDLACKLTMFLSECCTFCTILHITFLSLERYLAVCWPITAKTLVTRHRTRVLIGCLWLGAAVSAAPVLVMVGVEDVGGEELALSGWREDGGWMDVEGELGGLIMDGERGGNAYATFADGVLDGIKWEEDGVIGQGGERKLGIVDMREGINYENGGETKESMDVDGQQQSKMREDEGGGRGGGEDDMHKTDADSSECRCTHYAISSGLLSAMMIVSNLYFLVPLCVLGLVYSLIGRTLWLRPQRDSRRDKRHRHTVKMLGVIVLAFVLCWLPFHVGRTIFTLSLGTGADGHEAAAAAAADADPLSDIAHNTTHGPRLSGETSATANMAHQVWERHGKPCDSNDTRADKHSRSSHDTSHTGRQQTRNAHSNNNVTRTHKRPPPTVPPPGLHADARSNGTHTPADAHLYFLYYLSQYFNLVSSVFFYLSAAVNPLLYNLMSARYRRAVHSLFGAHVHAQARHLRAFTTRHSTTTC